MGAPTITGEPRATVVVWTLRIAGAALLAAMAWIHLDLWGQGYDALDVIGPAFLVNAVAGFALAVVLLVAPRPLVPWAAAAGALLAAGTLAGLLISTTVGLFGFTETTGATLWWESFWVEVAAVVLLTVLTVLSGARRRS